jgi:1,2-beta-oligoglucan phosphorylase
MTTTLPSEQQRSIRSLAAHDDLPLFVVGDPASLHFRFHPNGRLHSLRSGSDLMINLLFGCPLAGGLYRLYVEVEQAGRRDVVPVIGAGSRADFSADDDQAMWRVEQVDIAIAATLVPDPKQTRWSLEVSLENRGTDSVRWRAFHGLDVGLTSPSAARINEAYASQYIDHKALDHPAFGKVVASRQNLAVNGKHPLLLQACLGGCREFATDARDVFGGAIARSEPLPSCLQAGGPPLQGTRQGESSYVALRSEPVTVPSGEESRCSFVGIYADDHHEPSSAKCLEWLGKNGAKHNALPASDTSFTKHGPRSAKGVAFSIFDSPRVVHGEAMDEQELKTMFPGAWDVVERSPGGDLWSFFTGDDARHVVTLAKEAAMARPHATILRSGRGIYPEPDQMTTTCFAAGVFNSLLSSGHPSFHRLLSYPRESLGLIASSGQRIWIRDQSGWLLLGVPSFFEMGLADVRWCYRLPSRTVEVRVAVDTQQSQCRLDARVVSGPAAEFLITHGLVGGVNEYDEPAELEIDHQAAVARVRASADSMFRKLDKTAAFKIAVDAPSVGTEIGGAECLDGGSPNHAMLVVRTKKVSHFGIGITAESCAGDMTGVTDDDWSGMATALRLRGRSDAVSRLNRCLPWFVHNAMIHFSVPHGIEQYNGGAWGTRDVTQGSVEMLLALGRHKTCRQVLLDVFSHQYEDGHQWPQWFMLDPFGKIQQSHSHGDIPLWPLKALCDYLEASADFGILDEMVAWTRYEDGSLTDRRSALAEHLEDSLAWLRHNCSPGTALLRYKDGDWDDSLQPAKPEFRERLVSSWTVALCYQVLRRLEEVCRRSGRTLAGLDGFADDVRRDFHRFLVIDGAVCGFFLFDADSAVAGQPLLHPADWLTGIRYRLIPMTRSMLAGLFTPEEAEHHCRLIADHLMAADGARLMDRPPIYRGGVSEIFQRAESSSCFSREIGIMYVHAHLRYIEAMACMGKADAMLEAFNKANPAGLSASVPHALPRQANAYFSSSDAAVATRYEATSRYDEIKSGKMPVEGGWRIYSSGPGIFLNLVLTRMAGIRRHYETVVLDPVLPRSLDGLEVRMPWQDRFLAARFTVESGEHTPRSATLNGTALTPLALSANPYRTGGWLLDAKHFESLLKEGENQLEVTL